MQNLPVGYGAIDRQAELAALLQNLRAIRGPQLARKEQDFQEQSFNTARSSFDNSVNAYNRSIDTAEQAAADYRTRYKAYETAYNNYLGQYNNYVQNTAQNNATYSLQMRDYARQQQSYLLGRGSAYQAYNAGLLLGSDPTDPKFSRVQSGNPSRNYELWFNQNFAGYTPYYVVEPAQPQPLNAPVNNTNSLYPGQAPLLNVGDAPSFNYQPIMGKYGKALEADKAQERFASFQANQSQQASDPYQAIRQELVRASQRR